jgi:hypothetical protein
MSSSRALLTKSAFKLARTCPTKLYYYLSGYPSIDEKSEYGEVLKKGGHYIGRLAQLLYPEGKLIEANSFEESFDKTREALKENKTTLFEASFLSGLKAAKVDILKKDGNVFDLIEVKSGSIDGNENKEKELKGSSIFRTKTGIAADWLVYLEDVAFQGLILKELYPDALIKHYLLLPDKSKNIKSDGFGASFKVERVSDKLMVRYDGKIESILSDNFMTLFNVDKEVELILPEVKKTSDELVKSITPEVIKLKVEHGKHCKDCEYKGEEKNGFKECWGKKADISPNIFELWNGGALKKDKEFLLNLLIKEGKVSLYDIPLEELTGKRGPRQIIQINHTKQNKEWISPELKEKLNELKFPLYFIDFETTRQAIPNHKGLRPFEQIAFQWSCHILNSPTSNPVHKEWIHTEESYPNILFAKSLMETLGKEGSVLTWATHEKTSLNEIMLKLDRNLEPALYEWLEVMPERIVDMERMCQEHFFHPKMKGKTSLKAVLPSVWDEMFPDKAGKNPYDALPPISIDGVEMVVKEGTGAIIAYNEMIYIAKTEADKRKWEKLLKQYCELDTFAMVVIYNYWKKRCG